LGAAHRQELAVANEETHESEESESTSIMNQTLLHADLILRDRAREREHHVAEGRILRALSPSTTSDTRARAAASGTVWPAAVRAHIRRCWRGWCSPASFGAKWPHGIDAPRSRGVA
jgi:hypothetical protein